jgi:cytochrome c oxidase cbb3-type subunit III
MTYRPCLPRLAPLALACVLSACAGSQPDPATAPRASDQFGQVSPVGPLPGAAIQPDEPVVNPFADDAKALARGREYFTAYNCAGCHGDHGGGGMGPSLRDPQWIYGGSHASIADSIRAGRAYGMPAWGRMLTDAQVWQLAAYLKSMRTPEEPDPPRVE